ncbi:MAG: SMUG2 DNA glycosylase family protein [Clostridiaceae bacterium]|nr:SMUG2 DNA glycosylase family protein [Clostridiaceae bacterium]
MNKKMTFAEQILQFNDNLSDKSLDLPAGVKVLNPYNGPQKEQVRKAASAFYQKYYNDTGTRRLILGSTPARRGSSATGVPFADAGHLYNETGIYIDKFYINKPSSGFIYDVIREYGGFKKFYTDFYMNFVCPLGLSRVNKKGAEVNCNYYENGKLQEALKPFIISSIRSQIDFGIDTSVCFCIGSGKNFDFLTQINAEHKFFDQIIPLEHPRFIMQYNSKRKDIFVEKYIKALSM